MQLFELALHDTTVLGASETLGTAAFADAWSRGSDLSDDAIAGLIEDSAPQA